MNGIGNWIESNIDPLVWVANIIIGLVTVALLIPVFVKMQSAFSKKKMGEGAMWLAMAVIMAVVSTIGVMSVIKLGNTMRPDSVEGGGYFSMGVSEYTQTALTAKGII